MGIFDAFTQLILYVAYGTYVLVGCILFVVTVAYVSEIEGGSDYVTYSLGASALTMLFVGGVALFASWKGKWPILALVELINLALFAAILAAATIAFSK